MASCSFSVKESFAKMYFCGSIKTITGPLNHVCLQSLKNYARLPQPGMVGMIDIPFRFSVLTEGQGVKPAVSPLHPNIGQKPPFPPLPPEGMGVATFEVMNCRT